MIECELLGTIEQRAYRDFFVFAGDRKRALEEGMTPELEKLKKANDEAVAAFDQAIQEHEEYKALQADIAKAEADVEAAGNDKRKRGSAQKKLKKLQGKLESIGKGLRPGLAAADPKLAEAQKAIDAFETALDKRALELGDIHRDHYRFAHTRQPEQTCRIETLKQQYEVLKDSLKSVGTLTWMIEPDERNIAGWNWVGWKQHYEFTLDGFKVNKIRQVGTWELDGTAIGTTIVAMRYRGLGRIEQVFTGEDGGIKEAFTTTEIVPGAAGGQMLISPVVPPSTDVNDRGYALKHRAAAWIAHMARGGGSPFVDYQYRPTAAFCSFYEKQGGLRALTEAFPGDRCISQTDDQYFALTRKQATDPQVYLALVTKDAPLPAQESRTRWREVDQYVRDLVSEELGFVQRECLPGIGILSDAGWAGYYKGLARTGVEGWAGMGVRVIAYHNPGWINGRYQGPKGDPDTPPKVGGGVCNIYDYVPTKDVKEPWAAFQKACAKHGVAYYPWVGQTTTRQAALVQRIGEDRKHWSLNGPHDEFGPGYGRDSMKGNIQDKGFRNEFTDTLKGVQKNYGFQGFWVDSFQNLFMSQLNWAEGTGDSLERPWWEWIAAWSQDGVDWMAESHGFPGLSCSIEIHDWEKDVWTFQHVWKWLRGNAQEGYKPEELDRLVFRTLAAKGWIAPDHSYKMDTNFVVPSFKRLAHEYLAALPMMRRSYVLEDGMLWLPYEGNGKGVWFPFNEQAVPEGVTAQTITDSGKRQLEKVPGQHTYRVSGDNLLTSFGLRQPPLKDPRLGKKHKPAEYNWKMK